MDLSNAFDCLPRGLITAKLYVYGLELPVFKLLFLMCMEEIRALRFQNRNSWAVLTKGVIQGSILGPLFSNIFMNDLL